MGIGIGRQERDGNVIGWEMRKFVSLIVGGNGNEAGVEASGGRSGVERERG